MMPVQPRSAPRARRPAESCARGARCQSRGRLSLLALLLRTLAAVLPSDRTEDPPPQAQDAAYTAKIKEFTAGPRGSPPSWSITCPPRPPCRRRSKVLGRIPGTPDELTYSKDIDRYFDALDKASDRVEGVPHRRRPKRAAR